MRNPFDTEERMAFRETIKRYVDQELKPHADEWDNAFMRDLAVRQRGL